MSWLVEKPKNSKQVKWGGGGGGINFGEKYELGKIKVGGKYWPWQKLFTKPKFSPPPPFMWGFLSSDLTY